MRWTMWSYFALAGCYPLLRYLKGEGGTEEVGFLFWVVMIFQLVLMRFANLVSP